MLKTHTKKLGFAIIAFLLTIVFVGILNVAEGEALALEYGGLDSSSLWYYSENSLNVDGAKQAVAGWNTIRLNRVIIAVADTGIDESHPVFSGVLYSEDGVAKGYNARTKVEASATELSDTSQEKHGNAVAGIIAMLIKDFGLEDYIKIYPIKANSVSSSGQSLDTFSIEAVVASIEQAQKIGADVLNLSLGIKKSSNAGWKTDSALLYAIDSARDSLFIAAAAGNEGESSANDDNAFYPAAHSGVYGVMGVSSSGKIATNYGAAYDIAAPAEAIYTANGIDGSYALRKGSSMATAFASFGAALLKLRYYSETSQALPATKLSRYMRALAGKSVVDSSKSFSCTALDFGTIATQDFENTHLDYQNPESISVSHNGTLGEGDLKDTIVMHATRVKPITFFAKLNPYGETDPDFDGQIEWLLKNGETETLLAKGTKLEYDAKVYGNTSIVARLAFGENVVSSEQKLYIEYANYLVGEVCVTFAESSQLGIDEAPHEGVIYTNTTTSFSLTGIKYVDQSVEIKWFVDGELVATGTTFDYKPKAAGKHIISAQYGDFMPIISSGYVFSAEVKPFILRPLDLAMLIVGLVLVVGVVAVITAVCVSKKAKVKKNNAKNQAEIDVSAKSDLKN